MAKALVAASDPVARAGAELILDDDGSASDAIVAGILSAATVHSDVLLAPMVAMVGGVGAGIRSFDGRTRQPGQGLKRPRGFLPDDHIPLTARCSVPQSFATLALIHASARQRPLSALVRAAKAVAKQAEQIDDGLDARLAVLGQLAAHGATTLAQLARPLLHAAGPTAGGLLSEDDVKAHAPPLEAAHFLAHDEGEIALLRLEGGAPIDDADRGRRAARAEVIVAADGRGLVAAACYAPSPIGVFVPELGLRLPSSAVPILRGVPRVTPGTPLWTPSPIAVIRRAAEGYFSAMGVSGAVEISGDRLAPATAPLAEQLHSLKTTSGGAIAVAATVQRGRTSALAL